MKYLTTTNKQGKKKTKTKNSTPPPKNKTPNKPTCANFQWTPDGFFNHLFLVLYVANSLIFYGSFINLDDINLRCR